LINLREIDMEAIRIILAMIKEEQALKMKSILNENGFNVIDISNMVMIVSERPEL
jgi:hypothetical protein